MGQGSGRRVRLLLLLEGHQSVDDLLKRGPEPGIGLPAVVHEVAVHGGAREGKEGALPSVYRTHDLHGVEVLEGLLPREQLWKETNGRAQTQIADLHIALVHNSDHCLPALPLQPPHRSALQRSTVYRLFYSKC